MEWLLIIALVIVFIILLVQNIRESNNRYVEDNSDLLMALQELNKKYKFYELDNRTKYYENHSYKAKFDRDTTDKFMNRHIFENANNYTELLNLSDKNGELYSEYINKYDTLENILGQTITRRDDIKLKNHKFNKIENELYKKNVHEKPIISFNVEYLINYTSPKGRNSYLKRQLYSKNIIKNELAGVNKDIENKNTRQYAIKKERNMMTDGLRYEVLTRDGYSCQICGSTVKDGVKLHVDHIFPVSKGGKTEMINLQTLCDRCNLGKSDKF